jgi:dihydroxy-acid dehydratase
MFTANTMNCLTEVMGLALPGNGTIPAVHSDRVALAKRSGTQVMRLLEDNVRPLDILTAECFRNAFTVDVSLGGSTNSVLHLMALAHEAGLAIPLAAVNDHSARTPHLCRMSPAVGGYYVEDLHRAGGIPAVMRRLLDAGILDGHTLTVTGRTLAENIVTVSVGDDEVIRPLDEPHAPTGGLAVLFGSLAPEGAVVKQAAVAPEMLQHTGPARVFESEEDATAAIIEGRFADGDVLVVRNEGPQGGPGMREMLALSAMLCGMGRDDRVALITDGRFSGVTRGAAIGHISPEAAERGPLAAVQDGDLIQIDIPQRSLNVEVSKAEIARRLAVLPPWRPKVRQGYLHRYAQSVTSASTGAVFRHG